MSNPVTLAFDQLRASKVDLSPQESALGPERRRQLETQLRQLAKESPAFPQLSDERLALDASSRQTQIQPLEQLEIWLPLLGRGTQVTPSPLDSQTCWLKIDSTAAPLALYPDSHGYVSSTEVLKSLCNAMTSLPDCQRVELDATGQAVLLRSTSSNECVKIIPAIPVDNREGERIYHLIPNGKGNWMRHSAWLPVERFQATDEGHRGLFRPAVRLLKYWNRQNEALPEEDWEWLALQVFQEATPCTSLAEAIAEFFLRCPALLVHPSLDLTREGVELKNRWGAAALERAMATMEAAADCAQRAISCEERGEFEDAISWWRQVFREI